MDWVPGSARPLSSYQSSETAYVPDITSLDCVRNMKQYILASTTQMTDFCNNYFGNWNYQFTIQGILSDVTAGVNAFDALTRCDACIHLIVSKITDILANSKGGLDVTLALNRDALASAGCAGLSSTPAARQPSINAPAGSPTSNFFALTPGELWVSRSQQEEIDRKSHRAFAIILAANKLRNRLSFLHKGVISPADQATLAFSSPPLFVNQLNFTDAGVDPTTLANVSWEIVNNANFNPPPAIWDMRSAAEVGIVASDMNCTSHVACNPDSGDSPYWFCANSKVCSGDIPCDETERSLLNIHSRCVKGLCVDDKTAVDGKCPDIATCPTTATVGQFDHTYFAKFKNIAPKLPPAADLISAQGIENATAITQASSYATGVCDCAFGQKTDADGATSLYVANQCVYATCVAYAQMIETSTTCGANLGLTCTQLKSSCPNVVCDKIDAQWTIPTCDAVSVNEAGFALSSESKSAGMARGMALIVMFSIWLV
jgi:hypothetical protein